MSTLTAPTGLSAVRDLLSRPEPIASVVLGRSPIVPASTDEQDEARRWNALRARLWEGGADPRTIAAIAEHLAAPAAPTGLVLYASAGEIRLARELPGLDVPDRATFTAPAQVLPLLSWWQRHPAYVVVVIDRAGADVTPVAAGAVSGETLTVVGPDDEIEYNAPGGWAQPRYHRRAVDSWLHNASAVAATAAYAVERTEASLLLLAGDTRAAHLFRTHLPHGLADRLTIREVPGGRSPDGSWPARQEAIAATVRAYVSEVDRALAGRIMAGRGPGGTAVDGIEPTLAALAAGRVDTLLVTDQPDDTRQAWYGPDLLCADMPVPEVGATTGRLVDLAARAAILTDAQVRVAEPGTVTALADGIGATCRYR